jgi:adenylate kinase
MVILLFGPPGCGKGTQAGFIADRLGIPAISTGEMFRAECRASTPLGKLACSIISQGGLVGDEIANQIVAGRIRRPDCRNGFLLDGYPRTVPQAVFLTELLRSRGLEPPVVIHLDVPALVLVTRLAARRQCPVCSRIYNLLWQPPRHDGKCDADGAALIRREDDQETVIRERLKAYDDLTGPVMAYFGPSGLCRIDGSLSPSSVSDQIDSALQHQLIVS